MSEATHRISAAEILSDLASDIGPLEEQRLDVRRRARQTFGMIGAGLLSALAVGGGYFLIDPHAQIPTIALGLGFVLTVIVCSVFWFFRVHGPQSEYTAKFKSTVIGRLVSARYPGASYLPEQGITHAEYEASRLFARKVDKYEHEDLITGLFGKTDFRMSEVHSQYKTQSTDSEGSTTTHWHTIFKGLFFIADFNKSFNGTTLVLPESASATLSLLGASFNLSGADGRGLEPVSLENPVFEEQFAVLASDQVEARYILSLSLMERLTQFREEADEDIYLSFVNDHVFIALPDDENRFEPPSIWSKNATLSHEDVESYLGEVELAEDVVEALLLNRRIWSKTSSSQSGATAERGT